MYRRGSLEENNYLFCCIPGLDRAEVLLWSRREFKMEFESEDPVDVLHEIEDSGDLVFDLQPKPIIPQKPRKKIKPHTPAQGYKTRAYHPARTSSPSSNPSTHQTLHSDE